MSAEKKSVRWYEAAYIAVLLGVLALSMTYLRPNRVGVIDMDQAFRELGVAGRMAEAMREQEAAARARFAELQQQGLQEERALVEAFRAAATDADKARLQKEMAEFQARMQRGRAAIAGDVQRFQRDAVMTFRERVRPYAQKVAARKRVDIVIEPQQAFQVMNTAVNLTADTVAAAKETFTADQPLIDEALLRSRNLWIEEAAPAAGSAKPAAESAPAPAP